MKIFIVMLVLSAGIILGLTGCAGQEPLPLWQSIADSKGE